MSAYLHFPKISGVQEGNAKIKTQFFKPLFVFPCYFGTQAQFALFPRLFFFRQGKNSESE